MSLDERCPRAYHSSCLSPQCEIRCRYENSLSSQLLADKARADALPQAIREAAEVSGTAATAGIQVKCVSCKRYLKKPGGLLFAPPQFNCDDDLVVETKKAHICVDCWYSVMRAAGIYVM